MLMFAPLSPRKPDPVFKVISPASNKSEFPVIRLISPEGPVEAAPVLRAMAPEETESAELRTIPPLSFEVPKLEPDNTLTSPPTSAEPADKVISPPASFELPAARATLDPVVLPYFPSRKILPASPELDSPVRIITFPLSVIESPLDITAAPERSSDSPVLIAILPDKDGCTGVTMSTEPPLFTDEVPLLIKTFPPLLDDEFPPEKCKSPPFPLMLEEPDLIEIVPPSDEESLPFTKTLPPPSPPRPEEITISPPDFSLDKVSPPEIKMSAPRELYPLTPGNMPIEPDLSLELSPELTEIDPLPPDEEEPLISPTFPVL
jgi:hypothetical protein